VTKHFVFQKTVSPFGDFLLKEKFTGEEGGGGWGGELVWIMLTHNLKSVHAQSSQPIQIVEISKPGLKRTVVGALP